MNWKQDLNLFIFTILVISIVLVGTITSSKNKQISDIQKAILPITSLL